MALGIPTLFVKASPSLILGFANAVYYLAVWSQMIVVARLRGLEEVGAIGLSMAIISPIFALANLQLRSIQTTDHESPLPIGVYFKTRILSSGVALMVAVTVVAVAFPAALGIALALGLIRFIESISEVSHNEAFKSGESYRVSGTLLGRSLIGTAVFSGMLYSGIRTEIAYVGLIVVSGIFMARDLRSMVVWSIEWRSVWGLVLLGLPLGITSLIAGVSALAPRIALEKTCSLWEVGAFVALLQFNQIVGVVAQTASQIFTPKMSARLKSGGVRALRRDVFRLTGVMLCVATIYFLVLALLGEWLVASLLDAELAKNRLAIMLCAFAGVLHLCHVFVGTALNCSRQFKLKLFIYLAGLCISTSMAIELVARNGLVGACYVAVMYEACVGVISWFAFLTIKKTQAPKGPVS